MLTPIPPEDLKLLAHQHGGVGAICFVFSETDNAWSFCADTPGGLERLGIVTMLWREQYRSMFGGEAQSKQEAQHV